MTLEDRHGARPARPEPVEEPPVLPEVGEDERDEAWGDRPEAGRRDAGWYREQRPPHHGR